MYAQKTYGFSEERRYVAALVGGDLFFVSWTVDLSGLSGIAHCRENSVCDGI